MGFIGEAPKRMRPLASRYSLVAQTDGRGVVPVRLLIQAAQVTTAPPEGGPTRPCGLELAKPNPGCLPGREITERRPAEAGPANP